MPEMETDQIDMSYYKSNITQPFHPGTSNQADQDYNILQVNSGESITEASPAGRLRCSAQDSERTFQFSQMKEILEVWLFGFNSLWEKKVK